MARVRKDGGSGSGSASSSVNAGVRSSKLRLDIRRFDDGKLGLVITQREADFLFEWARLVGKTPRYFLTHYMELERPAVERRRNRNRLFAEFEAEEREEGEERDEREETDREDGSGDGDGDGEAAGREKVESESGRGGAG